MLRTERAVYWLGFNLIFFDNIDQISKAQEDSKKRKKNCDDWREEENPITYEKTDDDHKKQLTYRSCQNTELSKHHKSHSIFWGFDSFGYVSFNDNHDNLIYPLGSFGSFNHQLNIFFIHSRT